MDKIEYVYKIINDEVVDRIKFDIIKIKNAINNAAKSVNKEISEYRLNKLCKKIIKVLRKLNKDYITIDDIQEAVERVLCTYDYNIAKSYIVYRDSHKQAKFIKERLDYMNSYSDPEVNAATSSETDANANVTMKNVANLEGEVYKTTNRIIQRQRMKSTLYKLYPEVAKQYEKDINNRIIYVNDEASTPVLKPYCMAVTLYPLMTDGVGTIDGVTPSAPNDINSFSGQITNLAFLLSSQCKGAVAFGDYFVTLNYYIIKEFGENWVDNLDKIYTNKYKLEKRTVKDAIIKAFKQFVWGINQPAGNRGFQSPFINLSYFDKTYFNAMFGEFVYPDSTKPKWSDIDVLQRLFIKWFNKVRTKQVLTFPVNFSAA